RFGGRFRETYYSNVVQGARSRAYFLTTSHDGSGSITIAFTPVRIYCRNTLNAALKNCTNAIKIRHTVSAADKLRTAHEMLGLSINWPLNWKRSITAGHALRCATRN
ncbi:uncharacterized protein DUF932, partial [Mucilaginibacter yixingensis]